MSEGMSAWAIRHPLPPLVLCLLLTVLGALAWWRLPVQAMPAVAVPVVTVTVALPGASPADLERQVTRRLEDGLAAVAGVRHLQSQVTPGLSATTVEFQLAVPPDRAIEEVRDAVARVRGGLPAGVRDPVVERVDITGSPVLTIAVTGEGRDQGALSWFVDDVLARDLRSLPGVAAVRRDGGTTRELRLELDPLRLAALGLGPDQVDAALRGAIADLPGGRVEPGGRELLVRVQGATALAGLRLRLPDGRTVVAGDLGRVVDGAAEPDSLARLDGVPVVACAVFRAKGASEVAVADAVQARLGVLGREHPWAAFTIETDWVQPTRESHAGAMAALAEGALLAVAVVWLFLRDWRATAITALAIPLSVLPTFAAMHLLGFSLNALTLLAISLVSGILVDDAIVEIENIARFRATGLRPWRAALLAADRIGLAVVATTLALAAVFLPVGAMPGLAGRFFVEFAFTVVVAVLASLLVARLVTPLLAAYLLADRPRHQPGPGAAALGYAAVLRWCLAHRAASLGAAALLLAASLGGLATLPTGFVAASDRGQLLAAVEVPAGTSLAAAEAVVGRVSQRLRAEPGVRSVYARIQVPVSTLTANLEPRADRVRSARRMADDLRPALRAIPDQRFSFLAEGGVRDVTVQLTADDPDALAAAADNLAAGMRALPELAGVSTPAAGRSPELTVVPLPEAAARAGVDAAQIARTLFIATRGGDGPALPQLTVDGRQLPVRTLCAPAVRRDPALLAALRVPTADGGSVPLAAVAELRWQDGTGALERFDRRRRLAIEGDLAGGTTLGQALAAIEALPAWRGLPPGVRPAAAGDAEVMAELFSGFALAMGLGVLCVYLVLVLLYRDPIHPLTILAALPLSLGGAVLALHLGGHALDLSALIGLLMLMGLVCKNSILLVDEALQLRAGGMPRDQALVAAGQARARAILMTTLAMIAGMAPVLSGLAPDATFRVPMAAAVVGGLAASTVLSLVVVPVVFTVADGLRRRAGALAARLVSPPTAADLLPAGAGGGGPGPTIPPP